MRLSRRLTRRLKRGGGKKELALLEIPIPADRKISKKTINKAFNQKALRTHPDKEHDKNKKDEATKNMRDLLSARKILLDGVRNGFFTVPPSPEGEAPARNRQGEAQASNRQGEAPARNRQGEASGYKYGEFTRKTAEREAPPGGPGEGFEDNQGFAAAPQANNFTRTERANPHVYTRKKPPSPKRKRDVFEELHQLYRNTVGNPPSGNSDSDSDSVDWSDLMDERYRRNPQPKPNKKHNEDGKWAAVTGMRW